EKVSVVYSNVGDAMRQLQLALLRSLKRYHSTRGIKNQLFDMLSQIEILLIKGQVEIAKSIILKGTALSKKHNLHTFTFLFLTAKRELPMELKGKTYQALEQLNEERKAEAKNQLLVAQLGELIDNVNRYGKRDVPSKRTRTTFFEELIDSEFLDPSKFTDVQAEHLKYSAMATIDGAHFYYGDWERAREGAEKILSKLPDVTKLTDATHRVWVLNQGNVIFTSNMLLDGARALRARNELMDSLRIRKTNEDDIKLANLSQHDIVTLMLSGKYDEAIARLENLISHLGSFEARVVEGTKVLRLGLAQTLFMKGDYTGAIKYVNVHLPNLNKLQPTVGFYSRWLEVFCAYELRDEVLFDSKILALKRLLKKLDTGFELENEILAVLNKTLEVNNEERADDFKKLFSKFESKESKMELRYYFAEFDAVHWLEAKAAKKSYGAYLTEQYVGA
ncbi:MAG: hypothetical protein ACPGD8_06300, partial [Flavobacteriales bacterium]